jgi:predicted RNA-binding Zn ribbon-like protein
MPPLLLDADGLPDLRYVGGDVSLDLVNTAVWGDDGPVRERLTDYARFIRWAEGAGVIDAPTAGALRKLAVGDPDRAASALRSAIRLRDLLHRVFSAAIARRSSQGTRSPRHRAAPRNDGATTEFAALLDALNVELRLAMPHRSLHPSGDGARLAWEGMEGNPESVLWPVVHSAAELLSSADALRLRECAGADCGWMYVDRSRNGLRRWCEMETCGSRAKARRYYARTRAADG